MQQSKLAMETNQLVVGIVTAAFVFGAYFLGLFQGQKDPTRWQAFFGSITSGVTRRGVMWAVSLPAAWVMLYYGFIAHIWFALGRWPNFGERLTGDLLIFHHEANWFLFASLVASLYVVPILLLVCLFLRRWRHVSLYALCYGAAVGLASGCLFLAPHAFLNWLFD